MAKNKYKATSVNKHLGKGKKQKRKSGKQPIRHDDPLTYLNFIEALLINGNSTPKTD